MSTLDSAVANSLLSKELLRIIHNATGLTKRMNRQLDAEWNKANWNGFKNGLTLNFVRPAQATVSIGKNIPFNSSTGGWTTGAWVEKTIPVPVSEDLDWLRSDYTFSTLQLQQIVSNMDMRVVKPTFLKMWTDYEKKIISETIPMTGNSIVATGTVGGAGGSLTRADLYKAQAVLTSAGAPTEDRVCYLDSFANAGLSDNNATLFNPSSQIAKIYENGEIGAFAGADFGVSELLGTYDVLPGVTDGVIGSGTYTNGMTSINIASGMANGVYKKGTIFTITNAGGVPIRKINLETKAIQAGQPYQFALSEDCTIAGGTGVLKFNAAAELYSSTAPGAQWNIERLPVATDLVKLFGSTTLSYRVGCMWHPDAFAATQIPLENILGLKGSVESAEGFSARVTSGPWIGTSEEVTRFDVVAKGALIRNQNACRILTAIY